MVLTDPVPGSLMGVEFSADGGTVFNPWTGSLNLGVLAAGSSRTILIRGTVMAEAAGRIVNTARVVSSTPDPRPENNVSTVVSGILTPRCQALVDLVGSVALQEAALARMQEFIGIEGVTTEELFRLNRSVANLVETITRYESILQAKLQNVSTQMEDCALTEEI